MRIKGQNLRAFAAGTSVPEETNLSVTITGNTEDTSTKDSEGLSTRETVVSRSWQMQVETYDAQPQSLGALVYAFNEAKPIDVAFDQTTGKAGTLNREPSRSGMSHYGKALLSDLTLQFNNRQTVSVSAQYTGTGELLSGNAGTAASPQPQLPLQKGQYIRLFLSTQKNMEKVIAAATEMQLHFSAQTEDATTKDDTGSWITNEVTGQSYDLTGSALILTDDDELADSAFAVSDALKNTDDQTIYWKICLVSGKNNRTIEKQLFSGEAKLTQLELNGQNKQNATYKYTLSGVGAVSVEAPVPVMEIYSDKECTEKPQDTEMVDNLVLLYAKVLIDMEGKYFEWNVNCNEGDDGTFIGEKNGQNRILLWGYLDSAAEHSFYIPFKKGDVIELKARGTYQIKNLPTKFYTGGTYDTPTQPEQ